MSRITIPLALGTVIELFGIASAAVLLVAAPAVTSPLLAFIAYFLALVCLVFFPHCLAHYAVGRLAGIRFDYYYLTKSGVRKLRIPLAGRIGQKIPVLALKVDPFSLRSVSRDRRVAMFSAGAIASMVLPFISVAASFEYLPTSFTLILFLFALANFAFDLYYSPKAGDLAKAKSASRSD